MRRSHLPWLVMLALLGASGAVSAWGDGGHMMVATIAWHRLHAHARAEVRRLLAMPVEPAAVTARTPDFVSASYWADEIKHMPGFEATAALHFVDYPFSADGTPLPADLPQRANIVTALQSEIARLRDGDGSSARATALRFVIHFVGDIHQPLHCATRVSAAHPQGDRGGNDFAITWREGGGRRRTLRHGRLHAYWDQGAATFPRMGRHYAPPPLAAVQAAASHAVRDFPDSARGWQSGTYDDVGAWAAESRDIAETDVYAGLEDGSHVSAAYARSSARTAERRVAWAGYRLARLLNTLWP